MLSRLSYKHFELKQLVVRSAEPSHSPMTQGNAHVLWLHMHLAYETYMAKLQHFVRICADGARWPNPDRTRRKYGP